MRYLLLNPPVYDFAAYDYWLKPLGLLYISAILKQKGAEVDFLDCMDRSLPEVESGKDDAYGKGSFESRLVKKPEVLKRFKRKYRAYGLSGEKLTRKLKKIKEPDKIFLSSGMTYWYPGVVEAALKLKKIFPKAELILGGTYATLMEEHARKIIPADRVIPGTDLKKLSGITETEFPSFKAWPPPDYSGYVNPGYIAIRTSIGCPYSCRYCGIKNIYKGYMAKPAEKIKEEIEYLYGKYKVKDFVFYDDSLLKNSGFKDFLTGLPNGVRFHTPNGLEVDEITPAVAEKMKENNFIRPVLAADVIGRNKENKKSKNLNRNNIKEGAGNLFKAGYDRGAISAYLILGLPGQSLNEVKEGAKYLNSLGIKVLVAEYAVVPGSKDSKEFSKEVIDEPLLHNNSIFPSFDMSDWGKVFDFKRYVRELNDSIK